MLTVCGRALNTYCFLMCLSEISDCPGCPRVALHIGISLLLLLGVFLDTLQLLATRFDSFHGLLIGIGNGFGCGLRGAFHKCLVALATGMLGEIQNWLRHIRMDRISECSKRLTLIFFSSSATIRHFCSSTFAFCLCTSRSALAMACSSASSWYVSVLELSFYGTFSRRPHANP